MFSVSIYLVFSAQQCANQTPHVIIPDTDSNIPYLVGISPIITFVRKDAGTEPYS